ncbi:MAG: chalcone isomerase family protein, partial [Casimicrobium sp.]
MFLKVIVRAALAAFALSSVVAHAAIDVAGVKVEEKMRIGTTDTVLNGSGIRYAAAGLVRVYVASLYLPQK